MNVQLVTYNAELDLFAYCHVHFVFTLSGRVAMEHTVQVGEDAVRAVLGAQWAQEL